MTDKLDLLCQEIQLQITTRPDLNEIAGIGYSLEFSIKRVPRVRGKPERNNATLEDRGGITALEWEYLITTVPEDFKADDYGLSLVHKAIKLLYKRSNEPQTGGDFTGIIRPVRRYLESVGKQFDLESSKIQGKFFFSLVRIQESD